MTNILINIGASVLLLAGALVLATPEPAQACTVYCFENCWVNASGGFGCEGIECICH